jgi:replicative DNA helicase
MDIRHQDLYQLLIEMFDSNTHIDLITVRQWLVDDDKLESVGGLAYLSSLQEATASPAGLDYYITIVLEKYTTRKLIQTATAVVGKAFEHRGDISELVEEVESGMMKVREGGRFVEPKTTRDLTQESIDDMQAAHLRQGALLGIATGFHDLDRMTNGLMLEEFFVIGARPSIGKTALLLQILIHIAIELKIPVGVFSLEMSAKQLITRAICSRARVNLKSIRDGRLRESDFPKLMSAAAKISSAPIFIDDATGLSIMDLRARARRMATEHGVKVFGVDYIGKLHSTNKKCRNRQEEVSDISSGLKDLSREQKVSVIGLAQFNRDVEKRGGRPRLSDFRESGALEMDGDVVGLLSKIKLEEDEGAEPKLCDEALLDIAKARNGPTGEIKLTFLKEFTRFESVSRITQDDIPATQPHNY